MSPNRSSSTLTQRHRQPPARGSSPRAGGQPDACSLERTEDSLAFTATPPFASERPGTPLTTAEGAASERLENPTATVLMCSCGCDAQAPCPPTRILTIANISRVMRCWRSAGFRLQAPRRQRDRRTDVGSVPSLGGGCRVSRAPAERTQHRAPHGVCHSKQNNGTERDRNAPTPERARPSPQQLFAGTAAAQGARSLRSLPPS